MPMIFLLRSDWVRSFLGLFVNLMLASCSVTQPSPEWRRTYANEPKVAVVYVIDRGWHTDIGLAADSIFPPLDMLLQRFPKARYLVFGFGERTWFLAEHINLFEAIRALFPSPAAILVTALHTSPEASYGAEHVVALPLSASGLKGLDAYLWSYFEKHQNILKPPIAAGPDSESAFYASGVNYDATFTCNTWTAGALAAAGVPLEPDGIVFAHQVMSRVRDIAASLPPQLPVEGASP